MDNNNRSNFILRTVKELRKNQVEYEKLLQRKNKGEYVDDLIKQNRHSREILLEQSNKVWEHEAREDDQLFTKTMELIDKERNTLMKYDERYTYIEEIYDVTCKIGYKLMKNEEEYKELLERETIGEYVDDLITQNRFIAKNLVDLNTKIYDELISQGLKKKLDEFCSVEIPRKRHALSQIGKWGEKIHKNLHDWRKNEEEFEKLLKHEKNKVVRELIRKNRIYAEELRINYMKIRIEAKKWLIRNPELVQDPEEKLLILRAFRIPTNGKNEKPILRKVQKCPNCRNIMNYVEYFDGYQCPRCKKKYYLWENQLRIIGDI